MSIKSRLKSLEDRQARSLQNSQPNSAEVIANAKAWLKQIIEESKR